MDRKRLSLYPKIEPYNWGYMDVGAGHKMYYEECGNPNGRPILFVHGGPGAGCDEESRRYFDPKKWRIILFDQRGSGRSKPFGSIRQNTTQALVSDMTKLLDSLGISKVVLFGGSWGSTLSLVYAIEHPERVAGMVLRGIWLANKEDIDHYIRGGSALWYPDVWERFASLVPEKHRSDPLAYYYKKMTSGPIKERESFAYEWARYELSIIHLRQLSGKKLDGEIRSYPYLSLGVMEAHYITNSCFFDENFILSNIEKIPQVPISIVHGRYDAVCPTKGAWRLAQALPNARFNLVLAGHSGSEPEIQKILLRETNRIFEEIS